MKLSSGLCLILCAQCD